jgi:tRNA A37 threonylcarbamoyladenosine synthetase subunit TsaC/SUA5/YrdC
MIRSDSRTLRIRNAADRADAADALAAGEVAIVAFNGIFTLLGGADDPAVPVRVAAAKERPREKGVALVCPPEFLGEHAAPNAPALTQIKALQQAVHALRVILPAALPGAPPHVVQQAAVLNVWTEERPVSPLRELVVELRQRGQRALAGTSANRGGEPTISDPAKVVDAFSDPVPLMLFGRIRARAARAPPLGEYRRLHERAAAPCSRGKRSRSRATGCDAPRGPPRAGRRPEPARRLASRRCPRCA